MLHREGSATIGLDQVQQVHTESIGAVGPTDSRGKSRRYIATESVISGAFSGLVSLGFAYLLFGGLAVVPLGGKDGIIADAIPQLFMVVLMSTLIPWFLTRRRIAAGMFHGLRAELVPTAGPMCLRCLLLAAGCAAVLVALQAVILPTVSPSTWPFSAVLVCKFLTGALVGGAAAALTIRFCLRRAAGA